MHLAMNLKQSHLKIGTLTEGTMEGGKIRRISEQATPETTEVCNNLRRPANPSNQNMKKR